MVDTDGLGGSAVLTDCVPSKTLIATAELMADLADARRAGRDASRTPTATRRPAWWSTYRSSTGACKQLAADQSADIGRHLDREGVQVLVGRGRLDGPESRRGRAGRR